MSEMVERVTKAIRDVEVGYSIQLTKMVDGVSTYELVMYDDAGPREFSSHGDALEFMIERRDNARGRAAVEAMREPTEAMLHGARDWSIAKLGKAVGNRDATGCWQAMIGAAQE